MDSPRSRSGDKWSNFHYINCSQNYSRDPTNGDNNGNYNYNNHNNYNNHTHNHKFEGHMYQQKG